LSEGWDFVTGWPWLTVLHAALLLMGHFSGTGAWLGLPQPGWQPTFWGTEAGEKLALSGAEMLELPLALLPAWPGALLLPPALVLLGWRVMRYPYRYGPRRQRPVERWLLLSGTLLSWVWLGMEVAHFSQSQPEWLEALRLGLRMLFQAVAMALTQVVLVRLVIAWAEPEHPDDQRDLGLAVEHAFARWRGVAALAVLDLLVLLLREMAPAGSVGLLTWARAELMFVFIGLPAAFALVPGSPARQGMSGLKVWMRAPLAVLGVLITGLVLLALTRHASATMLLLFPLENWQGWVLLPVHALILATVRNWVFLAAMLTLLRHGLKLSSPRGNTAS
jgi:hypothetical protein